MFANDELPAFDQGLQNWLYDEDGLVRQTSHEIAQRLEAQMDAAARYYLWAALGVEALYAARR